jgi:hypothetical protein
VTIHFAGQQGVNDVHGDPIIAVHALSIGPKAEEDDLSSLAHEKPSQVAGRELDPGVAAPLVSCGAHNSVPVVIEQKLQPLSKHLEQLVHLGLQSRPSASSRR